MTIRVGLLGLNYGARVHLPAYKDNFKYEVVSVCARTPGRAEAVARDNNIPGWYTSPREFIAADLDLISIATPPGTHAGYAAAALGAGKHAVVEVAFVPDTRDARILLDMAQELGRVGATAYVLRYTPTLRLVADMLERGDIGRPRLMRFGFFASFLAAPGHGWRWIWDGDSGGGVLAGFVSHAIDLARYWFGPVREVDGALRTLAEVSPERRKTALADDTGVVTLHFESGMLAVLEFSAVTAYPRTHIELHGSEASLLIEGFGDEVALLRMGDTTAQPMFPPIEYLEQTRGQSGLAGGFQFFLDRLAPALADSRSVGDVPTFADGLEVTRLLDAVKLASRERRRVSLSEIG